MIEVTINDSRCFTVPGSWDELTAEQLKAICSHLVSLSLLSATDAQAYHLAKIALLLAQGADTTLPLTGHVQTEVVNKLLPALQYLRTSGLTRQLLPVIRIRKRFRLYRYHGPADNFANLSMGEFEDCEHFIDRIKEAPTDAEKEKAVNMLCAILYRPYADRRGDNRIEYIAAENEQRAAIFEHCDADSKFCILLYYLGCRNRLVTDFAMLFSGKQQSSEPLSWADFAHSLAGPVLGNIDDVYRRPVRQVFFEMRRIKMQADEIEEQKRQHDTTG